MVRGECLCGAVRFAIEGPVRELSSCHCSECRRAYGSAFGVIAVVERAHFRYAAGEERIRRFAQSARVNRYFCDTCGSPLPLVEDWDPLVGVPAGLLLDDPGVRVSAHIFVGSKAPWWTIDDDAVQHEAYPLGADANARASKLRQD